MAKIKLGNIVVDMRGKINGNVYAKGRYGAYSRVKVTPSNPRSTAQSAVRASFTTLSQAWRALSDAQRATWIAAAGSFAKTNVFGDTHKLTGSALYNSLNGNLAAISVAAVATAPLPVSVPSVTGLVLTAAKGTPAMSLAYTGSTAASVTTIVRATAGQSAGVNNAGSKFRQIGLITPANATPESILTMYTAKYGVVPAAGQKVFVEIQPIDTATGVPGAKTIVSCIVAA